MAQAHVMSLAAATLRSHRHSFTSMPPLDFSGVRGWERQRYFEAVHAALAGNMAPMMFVFERIVARTQRNGVPCGSGKKFKNCCGRV